MLSSSLLTALTLKLLLGGRCVVQGRQAYVTLGPLSKALNPPAPGVPLAGQACSVTPRFALTCICVCHREQDEVGVRRNSPLGLIKHNNSILTTDRGHVDWIMLLDITSGCQDNKNKIFCCDHCNVFFILIR